MPDELERFHEIRRATISPTVRVDQATLERLLETINRRHSRRALTPEEVYIFPGTPSNQRIDFYGTRMAPSSLANYQADIQGGIALMNSHRTGGFISEAELPIGRIFEAELLGEPIQIGGAEFDQRTGQELLAWHYLLRGVKVTDIANDDLIAAIEGGTIKDESIGFTLRPDGRMLCSICGNNYMRYDECPHVVFGEYENADGIRHRAFAWADNAHIAEASLVYDGATPGAMIRKAQELAPTLEPATLDYLEEHYQVRLRGAQAFIKAAPPRSRSNSTKGGDMPITRDPILEIVRNLAGDGEAEALQAVEDDSAFALGACESIEIRFIAEQQAATAQVEALERDLHEREALAAIGQTYRDDLVSAAVEARVRAEGNEFDAERYRRVLTNSGDLDFIKSERQTWEARAQAVLQGGPGQTRQKPENSVQQAPAAAYR